MKGRYFANIFIHFQPVPTEEQLNEQALPPYIIKGSKVAQDWESGEYDGEIPGSPELKNEERKWGQHIAHDAAGDGDLDELIRIAQSDQSALHTKDENGWEPIHEAVRTGNEDVIVFLKEQGVDLNAATHHGQSVLDIAIDHWNDEDSYIDWLVSLGATVTKYDLGPDL